MDLKDIGKLIRNGRIYDLGMEYYVGMPHHPNHPPFAFSLTKLHGDVIYEGGVTACNCLFTTGGHTGTHMDALGHVALDNEIFGVNDIGPWQSYGGLKKGGIDTVKPVVTRGVLLDVAHLEGIDCLNHDYRIGSSVLKHAVKKQKCSIELGDAVLIRTGWIKYFDNVPQYNGMENGCPGLIQDGAEWLVEQGVRYVGSDTIALEKTPSPRLPVHITLLVKNGIHILEAMNLNPLSEDRVYEFLFVVSPLKIRGGTASPVRPIALD